MTKAASEWRRPEVVLVVLVVLALGQRRFLATDRLGAG